MEQVHTTEQKAAPVKGNGHLLAAAPELLAALQWFVENDCGDYEPGSRAGKAYQDARAAIAKAEGSV